MYLLEAELLLLERELLLLLQVGELALGDCAVGASGARCAGLVLAVEAEAQLHEPLVRVLLALKRRAVQQLRLGVQQRAAAHLQRVLASDAARVRRRRALERASGRLIDERVAQRHAQHDAPRGRARRGLERRAAAGDRLGDDVLEQEHHLRLAVLDEVGELDAVFAREACGGQRWRLVGRVHVHHRGRRRLALFLFLLLLLLLASARVARRAYAAAR